MQQSFADRLRQVRRSAGLSVDELGDKTGLAPNTIYGYEKGNSVPTLAVLERLAKGLGVGLAAFEGTRPPRDGRAERRKHHRLQRAI